LSCTVLSDTLTAIKVDALAPDSGSQSERFYRVALEKVLISDGRHFLDSIPNDRLYSDLSQSLKAATGIFWSSNASGQLYSAATVVRKKSQETESAKKTIAYADSLFCKAVRPDSLLKQIQSKRKLATDSCADVKMRQCFDRLLLDVFCISAKTAGVLSDFIFAQEEEQAGISRTASAIKGLVFSQDKKTPATPAVIDTSTLKKRNDPKRALAFRSQESITDSIKKHVADLQSMYKRELKTHPDLQGTVVVSFTIQPNGAVSSAQIKSDGIAELSFLKPVQAYVTKIHFKPVPDSIGTMSFEFPFEFTPEN